MPGVGPVAFLAFASVRWSRAVCCSVSSASRWWLEGDQSERWGAVGVWWGVVWRKVGGNG